MSVYILLIILVLVLSLGAKSSNLEKEKQEKVIAFGSMLMIFLLLALKKDTVGIDIPGYKDLYIEAGFMEWGDYSLYHFEEGYVILTMLFSKMGIGFQLFAAFLYFIWCTAIYLLIRKYSSNATLSVLIFICYQFFVFSISGLRQTLAMALCIFALIMCLSSKRSCRLLSLVLIFLANTMHQSALVFFAIPVLVWLLKGKVHIIAWVSLFLLVCIFRKSIWLIVTLLFGKTATDIELGGNFIMLLGLTCFACFTYYYQYNKKSRRIRKHTIFEEHLTQFDPLMVRGMFLCLITNVMFAGSTMLRAGMYFTILLIPGIPSVISRYEIKVRWLLNVAFAVFLIILFYSDTLAPNQLSLCPYRFFWQ